MTPKSESSLTTESGSPEVTQQGLLLSLHLSNGQDTLVPGLSQFLLKEQVNPSETVLQKNWLAGVKDYYEAPVNLSAAKSSFQLAFKENPQFQAASDFAASIPGNNSNGNGGKTSATTSSSTSNPSQIFSDLPGWLVSRFIIGSVVFPRWLLIMAAILLLMMLFALLFRLVNSYRRRQEYKSAEHAAYAAQALSANERPAHLAQLADWSQQLGTMTSFQQIPISPSHPSTLHKRDLRCPRCLELIPADANYCPNCNLLISPSESGLHLRVKPNSAPWPITLPPSSLPTPQAIQTSPGSPESVKSNKPEKGLALPEQKPVLALPEHMAVNTPSIASPPTKIVHSPTNPPSRAKQEQKEGELKGRRLGNYRLLRLLGSGAFADVYLGEHVFLKTQAAIKVLHKRLTQRELIRFVEESRTIASLRHPHIIRVLEFGLDGHEIDLEQSAFEVEGSVPYLIMDYAPGGTLRTRHPKGTRLPLKTILPYITQTSDALYYAHSNRLIHRDVKPENILVGYSDQILLSDFGISVVSHSEQSIHTLDMAGTLPYMAPEQIRGKPRPASDQYALAVVLYEWLCGVQPFLGESQWDLMEKHINHPPVSPREKLPSLSPEIEAIVLKALNKDPQDRFNNIQAFANALEEAFRHEQL